MRAAVVAFALCVLAGCQNSSAWAGRWQGKQELKGAPDHFQGAAIVSADLKADGTCEFTRLNIPYTGVWKQEGQTIVLKLDRALQRPIALEVKLAVVDQNLSFHDDQAPPEGILLQRLTTATRN